MVSNELMYNKLYGCKDIHFLDQEKVRIMNLNSFKLMQSVISMVISMTWLASAFTHSYLWAVLILIGIWQLFSIKWIINHLEDILMESTALMSAAPQISNSIAVQMAWIYGKSVNWFAVGSMWIYSCAAYQYDNWIMHYTSILLMIVAVLLTGIKLGFLIKKLHDKATIAALAVIIVSFMTSCNARSNSDDLEDHRAQVSTAIRYQAEMANEDYNCGIEDDWLDVMQSKLDSIDSFESMDSLKSFYENEIHKMIQFQEIHKSDPME